MNSKEERNLIWYRLTYMVSGLCYGTFLGVLLKQQAFGNSFTFYIIVYCIFLIGLLLPIVVRKKLKSKE